MNEILSLPQSSNLDIEEISRDESGAEDIVTVQYMKLRPSLLSYVYHLIGSTRDAEDLVQIAFLKLFDQLNEKTEIQNVRGWLYRVVHNLAMEQMRQSSRRESLFKRWFSDYDREIDKHSIEQEIIARERIEKSLSLLNEKEQRCLMLWAEGLSYQEIADVLDMTAKSVSVYLARGVKKFESKNEDQKQ